MIENLVGQFMGSNAFGPVVDALKVKHGLNDTQARHAVQATAEGATEAWKVEGGGLGGLFNKIGSLFGGGGEIDMPPQLIETVVNFVTNKTGLNPGMARNVVDTALPKVIEFAKGMGGKGLFR